LSHEVTLKLSSGDTIKVKRPYGKHARRSFDYSIREGHEVYLDRIEKVVYVRKWTGVVSKYDLL